MNLINNPNAATSLVHYTKAVGLHLGHFYRSELKRLGEPCATMALVFLNCVYVEEILSRKF